MEKTLKALILSALIFLIVAPSFSLDGNGSKYSTSKDSISYVRSLSFYREFYKIELYEHAIGPWWDLFYNYPAASEKLYLDGVTMYHSFIEAAPDGPDRESLIDTLMLIYDQRMEYFGGEGNVLGRQGIDLLKYGREDIEQVQKAYTLLRRSIELEAMESKEAVIFNFISASISLNRKEIIDENQVIEDYLMVRGILDHMEGMSSRWKKARTTIDEIMLKEDIFSCKTLDYYYEPQFKQNANDKTFLEQVISFYESSGCKDSEIYAAALENLYRFTPGPESAHNLAFLFISRGDFPKAASYLEMAVLGANIEKETLAAWFYELAVVSSANKDYCEAIFYAREAILNNSDFGKAYMTLGDAIIASRSNLGDDFEKRAAFWAASDKYAKAASLDPSLEVEARQKLIDYKGQYPSKEEIFFRDLKEGDSYRVKGCINENTTVRSRI
ncbi:MAG: hypothetical protein E4H10_02375 [Bacteroidia bacterium]|nr:MAG: hypothetical protein E4H10_02375 [Bacteroidia bacterium]